MPVKTKAALDYGASVHKEFQNVLNMEDVPTPEIDKLSKEDRKLVDSIVDNYAVQCVEKPIVVDVGGHTINATPDGVLIDSGGEQLLWQLKTSSMNKAHHIDIVRYSLHECIYGLGVGTPNNPVLKTLLGRFIRTKGGKYHFYLDLVIRRKGDIEAARQYVVRICDLMEEMTLGEKTEGWQAPPSCIDWITGQKCDYFSHCHHGESLSGPTFITVPERYTIGKPEETEGDSE